LRHARILSVAGQTFRINTETLLLFCSSCSIAQIFFSDISWALSLGAPGGRKPWFIELPESTVGTPRAEVIHEKLMATPTYVGHGLGPSTGRVGSGRVWVKNFVTQWVGSDRVRVGPTMDFPRDYPLLSKTVGRVYCIAAPCTQSEREFSAVSRTLTDVYVLVWLSLNTGTCVLEWRPTNEYKAHSCVLLSVLCVVSFRLCMLKEG